MKFGSVCSGIEAASVAWSVLGWEASWFSEIEPFPNAVLAHHYPNVPNLGDMRVLPNRILLGEIEAPDILCGGTPCQAFSVAGKRQSLDDARGNLSLTFCEIANAIDFRRSLTGVAPSIIFWENVPGVLSTKDNAFGCFLGELAGEDCTLEPPGGKWSNAGCVFGPKRAIAWRILDAQYFGVAQRRRRVFVVASARDGFDPAAVLFEFDGVRRDTAPSRETGQSNTYHVAPSLTASGRGVERIGETRGQDPVVAVTCMAHGQGGAEIADNRSPTLTCNHEAPIAAYAVRTANTSANGHGISPELSHTLDRAQGQAVAYDVLGTPASEVAKHTDVHVPLRARVPGQFENSTVTMVTQNFAVRRLTPIECERLQGFPDNYTNIPYRNKPDAPDGPRYKALGNSWAVPVVRWIGERVTEQLRTSNVRA